MTSYSPQPNLFTSFFIFLTLPALHMPSHCWDRSNTIHFCRQRGQYPLSVLPLNQCIPSAGSLCRKRAGSNSKCFFQLPRLIVSSWRQYPVERTPFFPPIPISLQHNDEDADPNAIAGVPVGLLPCTQVNRLLRALPGLQGSRQLEKDYHKLMFTLWTPCFHLPKAPYHLPLCKQPEFAFLWAELTELIHSHSSNWIYNKYHQQKQENKQRKQLN